jgi:hypothetical protein
MNTPDTQPKKLNTDLIGGILVLAVAAFFQFHMDPDFTPLAAYFPERLITCMAVLGVLLLIKAYARPVYMDSFIHKLNAPVVFTILVGLAWVFLLEWLGFIISSLAAIFIILCRLEPRTKRTPARVAKLAAIAAGEVAVIYVVFVKLLYVTMPAGRLFG